MTTQLVIFLIKGRKLCVKGIRRQDNAVLAEAETDWIFVDAASGRLRSIPKEVATVFELLPVEKEAEILA